MQLPFTREQFFDLFSACHEAMWPAVGALWIASALVSLLLLSPKRRSDRWVSALLVVHWVWSALAYRIVFFTRINPAAWMFAALFFVQATLVFWTGVVQRHLSFAPWRDRWAVVAWLVIVYSLVYPGVNALEHLSLSRIPTFGVPCPTTLFTAGMLMAALLFDLRADYVLPLAGFALAAYAWQRRHFRLAGVTEFGDVANGSK